MPHEVLQQIVALATDGSPIDQVFLALSCKHLAQLMYGIPEPYSIPADPRDRLADEVLPYRPYDLKIRIRLEYLHSLAPWLASSPPLPIRAPSPAKNLLESSGSSSAIASPGTAFWRLCTPCLRYIAVRPNFTEEVNRANHVDHADHVEHNERRSIKTLTADSTNGKVHVHGVKPVEEEVVWICCKHIIDPVKVYQMT